MPSLPLSSSEGRHICVCPCLRPSVCRHHHYHNMVLCHQLYVNPRGSLLFLPARRYASAGLCDSDVSVRLSVRRSPVLCLAERKQDREMYTI